MSSRSWSGFVVVLGMLSGCASYPKVDPSGPLEAEASDGLGFTTFRQHAHQVDTGDAKDHLLSVEQSAADAKAGRVYQVLQFVAAGAGLGLINIGVTQVQAKNTSWPFFLSGALTFGASFPLGIAADHRYRDATRAYNRQLGSLDGGFSP